MLITKLMVRPLKDRVVHVAPVVRYFKPYGTGLAKLGESILSEDGYEALRLADREGFYHDEAARRMNISRQTFGRIVTNARRVVADAVVGGKALRIEGGNVSQVSTIRELSRYAKRKKRGWA